MRLLSISGGNTQPSEEWCRPTGPRFPHWEFPDLSLTVAVSSVDFIKGRSHQYRHFVHCRTLCQLFPCITELLGDSTLTISHVVKQCAFLEGTDPELVLWEVCSGVLASKAHTRTIAFTNCVADVKTTLKIPSQQEFSAKPSGLRLHQQLDS